jgi:outer membrane biosynthesis protein TonB
MSDAEPKSTSTVSRDPENANSRPSPVAVSEENLAALLRAMRSSPETQAERRAEGAPAASVSDVNSSSAGAREPYGDRAAAVTNPPVNVVESRSALFTAVKENRSAISRSELTPATLLTDQSPIANASTITRPPEHFESLTASLPPKVAPLPIISPETASLMAAPAVPIAIPPSTVISRDQSQRTSRTLLVIGLVIGAAIATVGVSTFLTRAHSSRTPRVVASTPKDNVPLQVRVEPPLQVRVEPLGNGLIDLRWNAQSASIAQAQDGRLVITEHNKQPRTLALEAEQLKTGHLTYQSAAESVEFDLEVVDRSGAIARESILALQAPISSPQPTRTPPQTQRGNTEKSNVQNVSNLGVTAEVPQLSEPKIRTFIPPAAQHNTEQRAFIDAPPTVTNGPAMPPTVGLPVPPAVLLPPPKKDGPAEQQVRVESNIQAANLIKKVIPIYPQLARLASIQGTVRFTANIGKDGRILNLKFMSGPPVLVESASAAVKQWVYRPTLLNGKPVEVITQIDVNFTLHENAH